LAVGVEETVQGLLALVKQLVQVLVVDDEDDFVSGDVDVDYDVLGLGL